MTMLWSDIALLLALVAIVVGWLSVSTSRLRILVVLAPLAAACAGAASIYQGRLLAVVGLGVALVFLALGLLVMFGLGNRRLVSRAWRWPIAVTAILTASIAALPLLSFHARVPLPAPGGSYSIGVRDIVVVDAARGSDWNASGASPRRILARIWFPASRVSGAPELMSNAAETRASRQFEERSGQGLASAVTASQSITPTHSHRDAVPAEGRFPLVLFSPGYLMPVSSNTSLMEHLASNGYVVVSFAHPNETQGVVLPDGEPQAPPEELMQFMSAIQAQQDFTRFVDMNGLRAGEVTQRRRLVEWFFANEIVTQRGPIWIEDFGSVYRGLQAQAAAPTAPDVLAHVDFERVGFAGHSLGALAAAAACEVEPACIAAAAMEVGSGPPAMDDRLFPKPLLVLDGELQGARLGGQDFTYERHCEAGLTDRVHRVHFVGAEHNDFTDFALLARDEFRANVPFPLFGRSSGRDLIRVENNLVSGFFDQYLRGAAGDFPRPQLTGQTIARVPDLSVLREWANRSHACDSEADQAPPPQ
ncbi:MAG TPA: hypothetical protein VM915_00985 [Verrucomicrobiae bacterium]|nr:hypothetical protein [Verrucomicrobiae bacterium]